VRRPEAQPAGTADGDSGWASSPSPLEAVDDLRSTAKWTLAAAGAVGAALISGGPLIAIGQVHGVRHAVIAGLGLLVALCGVTLAIWCTSKVLSPRLTTPADVRRPELASLRAKVNGSAPFLFGVVAKNVEELLAPQERAVKLAWQLEAEEDPAALRAGKDLLEQLQKDAARADPYVRWLVALAHVWQMETDLERSRKATLGGGALVIAGAVAFFSVTGSPAPTYVPVLTPQVTAIPTPTTPRPATPTPASRRPASPATSTGAPASSKARTPDLLGPGSRDGQVARLPAR
jgi:hypothetical protein